MHRVEREGLLTAIENMKSTESRWRLCPSPPRPPPPRVAAAEPAGRDLLHPDGQQALPYRRAGLWWPWPGTTNRWCGNWPWGNALDQGLGAWGPQGSTAFVGSGWRWTRHCLLRTEEGGQTPEGGAVASPTPNPPFPRTSIKSLYCHIICQVQ